MRMMTLVNSKKTWCVGELLGGEGVITHGNALPDGMLCVCVVGCGEWVDGGRCRNAIVAMCCPHSPIHPFI